MNYNLANQAGLPKVTPVTANGTAITCKDMPNPSSTDARNPLGTVRSIEELFSVSLAGVCSEVVGDANMLAENVTKDMVCTFCKKTGHSASFFMNGTQFHCPEKASKNDSSNDVKDKSYLLV